MAQKNQQAEEPQPIDKDLRQRLEAYQAATS